MEYKSAFSTIINNTRTPIAVFDDNWVIKLFNEEMERLLGYQAEEVVGLKSIKDIQIADKNQDKLFEKLSKTGKVNDYETFLIAKDKKKIPVLLSLSKITHEKSKLYDILAIAVDISQKKKKEEKHLRYLKELKKKIIERDDYIQEKYSLSSLLKHDTDNSYMIASNYLEAVISGVFGELDEMSKRKLMDVKLEVDKIRKRIYDYDYLFKMERGKYSFEPESLDLCRLLTKYFDKFESIYSAKRFQFRKKFTSALPNIYVDKSLADQLIFELFNFCIKQGGPGSTISVSANVDKTRKDKILITFEIQEGMTEEEAKIYKEMLGDTQKIPEDMGLSCSQEFIKSLHEEYGYEKKSAVKSCFWFTLPMEGSQNV